MSPVRFFVLGLIVTSALAGGGYFVYEHLTYVTSDNAQIGAHVTMLSSRVNGTVQEVFVRENQKVNAGDVLAQIDATDYSNASANAQAQVASLEARFREAQLNYRRAQSLVRNLAVSRERYDNAVASYKELEAKLTAGKTQLQQANLNVNYAKLVAPSGGIIARKSIEPGQFVPVGQPLFGFVATDERWVNANLKETDLSRIRIGANVDIDVDAIPDRRYTGEVESIGPSTGALFSLLPPDNATGNFTKVVQRVPIRIKLTNLSPADAEKLQAGLSAVVAIRIR